MEIEQHAETGGARCAHGGVDAGEVALVEPAVFAWLDAAPVDGQAQGVEAEIPHLLGVRGGKARDLLQRDAAVVEADVEDALGAGVDSAQVHDASLSVRELAAVHAEGSAPTGSLGARSVVVLGRVGGVVVAAARERQERDDEGAPHHVLVSQTS